MLEVKEDNPRDHALLWFTWETACRREGLTGLTFADLNVEAGEAIVHEKGKARTVYFASDYYTPLLRYLDVHPGGPDLFMGKEGPLGSSGIYSVFRRAAKAAEVTEKWSPHQWRHARSRYWLKQGMPLKLVSQLLGHSDISVTAAHYGALAQPDLKEAHKKYS